MLKEVNVMEALAAAMDGQVAYVFKNVNGNPAMFDLGKAVANILGDTSICRYLVDEDETPAAEAAPIADNQDYPGDETREPAAEAEPKKALRHSVDPEKIKELLEQGVRPVDIARELGIANSTVHFYRKRFEKMAEPVVTAPDKKRFTLEDDEDAGE